MNKNLCLNNSEKDWLLKVRSILSKPQPEIEEQPIPTPPDDEIWYTSSDGNIVRPASGIEVDPETGDSMFIYNGPYNDIFGADIISNTYENGKGIIKFDGDVTKLEPGEDFMENFNMFSDDPYVGSRLTSINLPGSVTSIGQAAFKSCTELTSIIIPSSVTSIGNSVFYSCYNLSSIIVNSNNSVYDSRNRCNAIIETATNTLILGCKNTIIPNSVTSIGDSAFSGCTGLTSINIPGSVTSIGDSAFKYCTGLTSINIPESVTSIGDSAFKYCTGLTSINIPESVTSIENGTFANCWGLTSINIPNSVTSIGDHAFSGCTGLTSINIPNSVTSIGEGAFWETGLTSINIPENVTSIEAGAFLGSGLTSLTIPGSVTSIGGSAFERCTGLTSIISLNTTPPTLGSGAFDDTNNSPIYVPSASVDTYKSASGWSTYSSRIQAIQ